VQYRQLNFKNDILTCHGKVTRKYIEDGRHYVDLDVWVMNQKNENTTPGYATVILPSRNANKTRVWE
jgi:hypothetical protein